MKIILLILFALIIGTIFGYLKIEMLNKEFISGVITTNIFFFIMFGKEILN